MQPEDLTLAARVTEELLDVLKMLRSGVDEACLSAKGAQRTQEMLTEQARTIERIVDSLRKRSDELLALQKELERHGAVEAAVAVGNIASEFRAAFATAAGPMRRWVLGNEAGAEALKIAKAKMNVAMQSVLEAADISRLLGEVLPHVERPSAPTASSH
jgi:hypothetical protein